MEIIPFINIIMITCGNYLDNIDDLKFSKYIFFNFDKYQSSYDKI